MVMTQETLFGKLQSLRKPKMQLEPQSDMPTQVRPGEILRRSRSIMNFFIASKATRPEPSERKHEVLALAYVRNDDSNDLEGELDPLFRERMNERNRRYEELFSLPSLQGK